MRIPDTVNSTYRPQRGDDGLSERDVSMPDFGGSDEAIPGYYHGFSALQKPRLSTRVGRSESQEIIRHGSRLFNL